MNKGVGYQREPRPSTPARDYYSEGFANGYADGLKQGHEQGRAEGIIIGKREMLDALDTSREDRRAQRWLVVLCIIGFVAAVAILVTV